MLIKIIYAIFATSIAQRYPFYIKRKFENLEGGFDAHREIDHNQWNYLYYMYHIKKKDETEFNGMESYVHAKIENDDITFFPMYRAICIKSEDEEKDNIENQIDVIIAKLDELNNNFHYNT